MISKSKKISLKVLNCTLCKKAWFKKCQQSASIGIVTLFVLGFSIMADFVGILCVVILNIFL